MKGENVTSNQHVRALRAGILFRLGSFWVGWHWSPFNKRLCVNFVPFLTVWIVEGLGQSRELSLAKTKIEECVFWGVKHLTR